MTTVLHYAALACLVGGVVAAAVALVVARNIRLAFHVLLDLWLAAGLIRLAQPPSWERLVTVVVIIAIRHLVGLGLGPPSASPTRADQAARHVDDPPRAGAPPGR